MMQAIRASDNKSTELLVFEILRAHGLVGVRRHFAPSRPADLAIPVRSVAVLANGCFWHGCKICCAGRRLTAEWRAHIAGNRLRDLADVFELKRKGWSVIVLWEHELSGAGAGAVVLQAVLGGRRA